jgi:two-component system, NarL family, response regulator LiaR
MKDGVRPIRLILVDDHSKIHQAIRSLLSILDGIELVAQGSSGQEAVDLCDEFEPDVVLMDVIMPQMDGIEATRLIKARHPSIKILALSGFQDEDSVKAMLQAGAVGYVLKDMNIDSIGNSIRTAYEGKSVFSKEVMDTLLQPRSMPQVDYHLTRQETEVLKLVVRGHSNPEIANTLTISLSTVKFHVSNILQKLKVNNRTEAVSRAKEQKLVD